MNATDPTDLSLLNAWRTGNRAAGDQLLRRYEPLLHRFFARKVSGSTDELVQRTLVACVQAITRFEGRSSFKSYLLGIAHNQFLMSLRARGAHDSQSETLAGEREETPSQLVVVKQEFRLLLRALAEVGAEFGSVLSMYYWDGMSISEIAEKLQIAPGTVKSRLWRGRAALKVRLLQLNLPPESLMQQFNELGGGLPAQAAG